jgi:uncharacterized protein YkwD
MKGKARFIVLLAVVALCASANSRHQALSSQQIVDLVNRDRISHGLPELSVSPLLSEAAYSKARDMVEKNYFAHTSPSGLSPWHWFQALGYDYSYAGENLAEGFSNAQELENSWMNSPKHRANILSPFYSQIGLAVVNEGATSVVVQFFGAPENKLTLER